MSFRTVQEGVIQGACIGLLLLFFEDCLMTWVCMIGAVPAAAEAVAAFGRRLVVIGEPDSDVPGRPEFRFA